MPSIQLLTPGPAPDPALPQSSLPHVLLVVDGFPKALGGGERIVLRLASLLPRYGFRASILTFAVHPESSFRPEDAPCAVYLLPLQNTYGPAAWRGALALRRLLRDEQVRIVQTFFESSDLWAGAVTRLFSSARLIWSRRDMGILRGAKHRWAYRALRRLPDAVFAVSAKVAAHVTSVDGVPPNRVHVIYNGIDLAPPIPSNPMDSAPVVTTIGNIRHVKGHDILIQAAAQVVAEIPHVQFSIAGEILEPAYFSELESQVAALGLSSNFRFLGNVEDLPSLLAAATIFVLPSRSEGFSNALLEALSMGLPCVATDVGGNAEALDDGSSGLIVPPEDVAALARALTRVLLDPALANNLSVEARRAATEKFTTNAMMRRIAEQYTQLLSASR